MDVDDLLRWVGNFRPRYTQPKEGRAWVSEVSLHVMASEAFRKSWDIMCSQIKMEGVRVEPQRWAQSGVQKQDLRALAARRS